MAMAMAMTMAIEMGMAMASTLVTIRAVDLKAHTNGLVSQEKLACTTDARLPDTE